MGDITRTVLNTLIALIVGTLFGNWLRWLITQPRIRVEGVTGSEDPDRVYTSLVITNLGRTQATSCEGSITFSDPDQRLADSLLDPDPNVDEALPAGAKGEGGLRPGGFRTIDRELLCWAKAGNPSEIDVNPGSKVLLDVFKSIRKPDGQGWYLIIPTEDGWRHVRCRLKDGDYSGTLIISPANGRPVNSRFRIERSKDDGVGPTLCLQ